MARTFRTAAFGMVVLGCVFLVASEVGAAVTWTAYTFGPSDALANVQGLKRIVKAIEEETKIWGDMLRFSYRLGVNYFNAMVLVNLGGMWIPFAVSISAVLYLFLYGGMDSFRALGLVSWGSMNSFTLTAVPLYILMAELLLECGLSHRIYRGLSRVVQRLPGGLLQTNIAGCAVFAAISGSSAATAAAIGTVALPRLKERGYDVRLATGTLAAGGTLGILIPPSIAMIIYGTLVEASIAKLECA